MNFLPITKDDIIEIREFDEIHGLKPPVFHSDTIDELTNYLQKPSFIGYRVMGNKKMIGHVSYFIESNNSYYLNAIVIHKDYRRKGIASKILRKVTDDIRSKGGNTIILTVSPLNKEAVHFYRAKGFVEYDFKKDVYGPGLDRLYMKLDLRKIL